MFFFLNCVLFCFTVAAPATQTKSSGKPEINQQEFTQLQQQLQDMKEQVICNFLLRLSANHIDEYNFDQARDLTHVTFPALGTGCESIFWSAALVSRFWFKPLKFAQMLVFFCICMLSVLPVIQMLETFWFVRSFRHLLRRTWITKAPEKRSTASCLFRIFLVNLHM